ncbi:hypothetical protein Lalb_Chr05g0227651 [Lupinus albus]|uniref:Uncharacterized protein n=1 Tax=Lupinus albus TaxID=3870 RepID=A0A6A4QL17_LUPAL|nr:hypothetical protein Lalb_Chr05g0227651 [Lupinus albus]
MTRARAKRARQPLGQLVGFIMDANAKLIHGDPKRPTWWSQFGRKFVTQVIKYASVSEDYSSGTVHILGQPHLFILHVWYSAWIMHLLFSYF